MARLVESEASAAVILNGACLSNCRGRDGGFRVQGFLCTRFRVSGLGWSFVIRILIFQALLGSHPGRPQKRILTESDRILEPNPLPTTIQVQKWLEDTRFMVGWAAVKEGLGFRGLGLRGRD